MRYHNILFSVLCMLVCIAPAMAQKPFSEGTIVYHVALTTPDSKMITGSYVFQFKNKQVRKELTLDNGYCDITLLNGNTNTIYSLQKRDGRKYAITLSMEEMLQKQSKFRGLKIIREHLQQSALAEQVVYKGYIMYKDSSKTEVVYSKEWTPELPYTYNRFPDAPFMPLQFSYIEESGIRMLFLAEKMEASPVTNAAFTIPKDYKIISFQEYKQLSR